MDLFNDTPSEMEKEFKDIKNAILNEIDFADDGYLYDAAWNGGIDKHLDSYYSMVEELKDWIDSNDLRVELMEEAENLLELVEFFPVNMEITLDPEIEELLKERDGKF